MLCHSPSGMSLPVMCHLWPLSWVSTARAPCALGPFCAQNYVCSPSCLTISFRVSVSWDTVYVPDRLKFRIRWILFLWGADPAEATPDWQPGRPRVLNPRPATPVCTFPPVCIFPLFYITRSGLCVPPPPKPIARPLPQPWLSLLHVPNHKNPQEVLREDFIL